MMEITFFNNNLTIDFFVRNICQPFIFMKVYVSVIVTSIDLCVWSIDIWFSLSTYNKILPLNWSFSKRNILAGQPKNLTSP